jgi:hypothetical protein
MDLLESVGENFDVNFVMKEFPAHKQFTTGLLIGKKQKHKCRVLTDEKLDDKGARLEHTRRKSPKYQLKRLEHQNLAQEWQHNC